VVLTVRRNASSSTEDVTVERREFHDGPS
jgi:hypothetical protein